MSNAFICFMGIGIVFFGLVCIVLLCTAMSARCRRSMGKKKEEELVSPAAAPVPADVSGPDRQQLLAAISAALAEDMGTDISAIRIVSFKKI